MAEAGPGRQGKGGPPLSSASCAGRQGLLSPPLEVELTCNIVSVLGVHHNDLIHVCCEVIIISPVNTYHHT